MSRPYFHCSTAELQALFEKGRSDRTELEKLAKELDCRSTKLALSLKSDVHAAIKKLKARTTKGPLPVGPRRQSMRNVSGSESQSSVLRRDDAQRAVVEAAGYARILVDAGPGTGKTAVACRRVAHLIGLGVEPANVWLLSFTRTAVHEVRNRIKELAKTEAPAVAVKIFTLDSQAWQLVNGFANDSSGVFGGYSQTIDKAIALLEKPTDEAREYFEAVEHLIVDEAQDLVGNRADMVELLINAIPKSAGITVLCDEAQAIYGFAEHDTAAPDAVPLAQRIKSGKCGVFDNVTLTEIHRTDSPGLRKIFSGTRQRVLSPRTSPSKRFQSVREEVRQYADGQAGSILEQALSDKPDALVLFRRRAEVLRASSYLSSNGIAHRVRMSGLPSYLPAWIAGVLWDHEDRWLQEGDFNTRLASLPNQLLPLGASPAALWQTLVSLAGISASKIDVHRLRTKLSVPRPPIDLCIQEIGDRGPIVGTIHASKGREAPTVHLMMTEQDLENPDLDEETRILYVGATRARKTLLTGQGEPIKAGSVEGSDRCYTLLPNKNGNPRAQIEIGREGDIDTNRQVGRSLFKSANHAIAAQTLLRTKQLPVSIAGHKVNDDQFLYHLKLGGWKGELLAALTRRVNDDIGFVLSRTKAKGRQWPFSIPFINWVGVRSVAVAADSPFLATLHPPFSESGFFLAPVIMAYTTIEFPPKSK